MRTGVLGGTFNPIHVGHLIVAQWLLEDASLTKVLFVPSATPPQKAGTALYSHRSRMVSLAIADNPGFELCEIEAMRKGPSYTVDTLGELRERYGDTLFFIIGTEAFLNIHTWHEPVRVLGQANMLVMERAGFEVSPGEFQRYLEVLSLRLPGMRFSSEVERRWRCEVDGDEHSIYLTPVPQIGISSSMVRSRVGGGLSVRYLVKGEVERYIGEHGLYCSGDRDRRES